MERLRLRRTVVVETGEPLTRIRAKALDICRAADGGLHSMHHRKPEAPQSVMNSGAFSFLRLIKAAVGTGHWLTNHLLTAADSIEGFRRAGAKAMWQCQRRRQSGHGALGLRRSRPRLAPAGEPCGKHLGRDSPGPVRAISHRRLLPRRESADSRSPRRTPAATGSWHLGLAAWSSPGPSQTRADTIDPRQGGRPSAKWIG